MRIKLTIAYNGSVFYGSQVQRDKVTVNGAIENALRHVGITTKVHAAGRTDRGVHATAQVLHIDIPPFWSDVQKLHTILNQQLQKHILIKKIETVSENFHARYSAKSRVYRYVMKEKIKINPFESPFVSYYDRITIESLNQHINYFLGTHDFRFFAKHNDQTLSTIRTIQKAFAYQHKDFTILYFQANGFLRSQIRMMVAMLLTIQSGKATKDDLLKMLTCKERVSLKLAPPNGLYLAKILY